MGKGIYVATSGSIAQLRHLEQISNNLANARTTGFKADRMTFEEVLANNVETQDVRERDKHYVATSAIPSDLRSGAVTRTDNPLDVAVTGNGMLKVETDRGVRLTRGGQLTLGRDGTLRTNAGHAVLADNDSRIVLPPETIPEIDEDGAIWTEQGKAGRLGVVSVDLMQGLEKDPDGLFVPGVEAEPSPDMSVMQGHLEESNVSPVKMMLDLINVQRTFSALRQVITTSGEMDQLANRLAR
jgi:flagellar basal-body rod protein FlgF